MNLANCPICNGELEIRCYHCPKCDINFEGSFSRNWLEGFSAYQLEFIKLFLLVQGNLKEMQKHLGISYPTIKNRLAEINAKMLQENVSKNSYEDILADLEEGFISVEEALNMINQRRNNEKDQYYK
ncbi:MAG: DUF2089 domain-containing protein [Candidatus Cloacimonetes bacterium]|nr:DUF2089 domain-containing protein [Candidatus Cloacimonadota bacterium]